MAVFNVHVQETVQVTDDVRVESDVQITPEMEEAGARRIYEMYQQMHARGGLAGSWEHAKWGAREIFEAMMKEKK